MTSDKHDLPWDDWDAFAVRVIRWFKEAQESGGLFVSMFFASMVVLCAGFCVVCSGEYRHVQAKHCDGLYERWDMGVDEPTRDAAYAAMRDCRAAGDKKREAYFREYLERTRGEK